MVKNSTAKKTVKGYKIVVQGQYRARGEKGKTIRFYKKEEFCLPKISKYVEGRKWKKIKGPDGEPKKISVPNIVKANSLRCANHIIQRYLLPYRLQEKYEDFDSIRTCHIVKKSKLTDIDADYGRDVTELKIEDMTESELNQFIRIYDITVEMNYFQDVADKRMAVEQAFREQRESSTRAAQLENYDENMTDPNTGDMSDDDDIDFSGEEKEDLAADLY